MFLMSQLIQSVAANTLADNVVGAGFALAVGGLELGAGLGVAGLGAYAGYRAFTENSRINQAADKDTVMLRSWFQK